MKKRILLINFKTYEEATGKRALALAKICDKIAKQTKIDIRIAVQAADLALIKKDVKIPVYGQHFDIQDPGKSTGSITGYSLKQAGARGSILNHSEKRISKEDLKDAVKLAKYYGLDSCVCVQTLKEAEEICLLKPDLIALELPGLIGGNVSITKANPHLILDSAKTLRRINPKIVILVGAGITTKEDVKHAFLLGADGVLLASHFVLAKDPEKFLKELVKSIK